MREMERTWLRLPERSQAPLSIMTASRVMPRDAKWARARAMRAAAASWRASSRIWL